MVLVVAGNDALRTVKTASAARFDQTAYVVTGDSEPSRPTGPGRRQR